MRQDAVNEGTIMLNFSLPLLLTQWGCKEPERPVGTCSFDISGSATIKIDNSAVEELYSYDATYTDDSSLTTDEVFNDPGYGDSFLYANGEVSLNLSIPYRDQYIGAGSKEHGYQPVIANLLLETDETHATINEGSLIGDCQLNGALNCFDIECPVSTGINPFDLP
jgi:hypothetical protein